ncbi:MAG: hypothetical protein ABEK16_04945 [Candidatus Nanohalobium sp.]
MKQFLKIVRMMMLEEWRAHSRIYHGRSFALFPVMVFILSAGFSYITLNYSTLTASALQTGLAVLGGFFGLAAGAVGFYGKDAFRNILGRTNYIIYSSRTLPLTKAKLGLAFLVKDTVYYSLIMVLPVVLGFALFAPSILSGIPLMLAAFLVSAVLSLGFTHVIRTRLFSPGMKLPTDPLTSKAVLDISRSSGGFLKVIFSLGVLTFFYWYFVLFFPTANAFLKNPLLSFAVITGLANLSTYNWINRFDSYEDYEYLPVSFQQLVDSKKKAYVFLTLPLSAALILIAYLFYPGNLLLALLMGFASTMYSLVVAEKLTKLKPNLRFYQAGVFAKLLVVEGFVVVPLLVASVLYDGVWIEVAAFSFLVLAASALIEEHW